MTKNPGATADVIGNQHLIIADRLALTFQGCPDFGGMGGGVVIVRQYGQARA